MTTPTPDEGPAIDQARQDWEALSATRALLFPDAPESGAPWPENLSRTPLLLDVTSGWTASAAVAVAAAAHAVEHLALVLTADEAAAAAVRELLDDAGRGGVVVGAGESAGLAAVQALCARSQGPIRWVGFGAPVLLAALAERADPPLARLRVTQLQVSGAVPAGAQASDPSGPARAVLRAAADGALPLLDVVSVDPVAAESADLGEMRELIERATPGLGRAEHEPPLLAAAVALATALAVPFVDPELARAGVDDQGRFRQDEEGVELWWNTVKDYQRIVRWLDRTFNSDPVGSVSDSPASDEREP